MKRKEFCDHMDKLMELMPNNFIRANFQIALKKYRPPKDDKVSLSEVIAYHEEQARISYNSADHEKREDSRLAAHSIAAAHAVAAEHFKRKVR